MLRVDVMYDYSVGATWETTGFHWRFTADSVSTLFLRVRTFSDGSSHLPPYLDRPGTQPILAKCRSVSYLRRPAIFLIRHELDPQLPFRLGNLT